ncbi:MAG: lipopolysaccharide heptosyltransferase family protein [Bacteroidetes bacterium]|nr:MAG: lipopolysaccharide heptosyltransferase family protein [Bacteroidota bacterium]TAG90129.1 MAG: lipopolysaccharide heptosyltransferase family protein [Bacteroidota bacterium]
MFSKIIISRTDNLGDVVLTLPLAGYLKTKFPNTEIIFIGKKYTQNIINLCSYVDVFLDKEEIIKDNTILENLNADVILFVFPDKQLAKIAKKVKIKNRVGTSNRWFHWLYCNKLAYFSRKKSNLHESELNFKLLKPLKISDEKIELKNMWQYYGTKHSIENITENRKNEIKKYIDKNKFNLILHPKSKGNGREWGLDNFQKLIDILPTDKFQILITGVKEEGEMIKNQLPQLFEHQNVINLTGQLNIPDFLTLIEASDGLVASGTGPLHLAALLEKLAIGIFPPMKPIHPTRWKPLGKNAHYFCVDKNCNDCKKTQNCSCMQQIAPEEIKNMIISHSKHV